MQKTLTARRFLPLQVDRGYSHNHGKNYVTYNVKCNHGALQISYMKVSCAEPYIGNNERTLGIYIYIYKVCIISRTYDVTYNDETLLIHVCIIYGTPLYLYMCIYIYIYILMVGDIYKYIDIYIYLSFIFFVAPKDKTLYMYMESCIYVSEE